MFSNIQLPNAAGTSLPCRGIVKVKLGKRESNAAVLTAVEACKTYKVRVGLNTQVLHQDVAWRKLLLWFCKVVANLFVGCSWDAWKGQQQIYFLKVRALFSSGTEMSGGVVKAPVITNQQLHCLEIISFLAGPFNTWASYCHHTVTTCYNELLLSIIFLSYTTWHLCFFLLHYAF